MPSHLKSLNLKPHVFAVQVQDDLVLLDIDADRYFCFPEAGGDSLSEDRRSLRLAADATGLDHLVARRPSPASAPPPLPTTGVSGDAARGSWRMWGWLLGACLDLARCYPGRAFGAILTSTRRACHAHPADPAADARALAAASSGLVAWVPMSRKCLVRSLLLRLFLARAGASADWVFGVRTWPFGAHCWLQVGDTCLDDEPERLAGYHPILVV